MQGASFNVAYLFLLIYNFILWIAGGFGALASGGGLSTFFTALTAVLAPIGTVLWLGLAAGIAYFLIRIEQIRKTEREKLEAPPQDTSVSETGNEPPARARWQEVLFKVGSQHPADWRIAVLEADIILDEALSDLGFSGSMGDKLQSIKSDTLPLNAAWEAHKVRNLIAHEGAGYDLTEREAKQAIGLYQVVLESLHHI